MNMVETIRDEIINLRENGKQVDYVRMCHRDLRKLYAETYTSAYPGTSHLEDYIDLVGGNFLGIMILESKSYTRVYGSMIDVSVD